MTSASRVVLVLSAFSAVLVASAGRPPADLFQPVLWDGAINERTAANPHMQSPIGHISLGFPPVLADMSTVLPYAQVAFSNSKVLFEKSGWHGLFVEVSEQLLPMLGEEKAYYAAGFGEGYVTAGQIYDHYRNSHMGEQYAALTNASKNWINDHISYMYTLSAEGGNADPYNNQLRNLLALISGITDGYNNAILNYGFSLITNALNLPPLTFVDIFLLSFSDEIDDVAAATYVANNEEMPKRVFDAWQRVGTHCSALVKRVTTGANVGEIYFSHVTWGGLEHMLRMYKTYRIGSFQVQFSGFPGNINSGDDFYVLNNNLTVMETTNNNMNKTSLLFVVPQSVSEFMRVMIMHKISGGSAQVWATRFCEQNSGTYNNQWMVMDMGSYNNDTTKINFWVTEQMPGLCVTGDQSEVLRTENYWASYNRPFYPDVFAYSGFAPLAENNSSYYSYSSNYRAEIFRRDQGTVVDEATMQKIMRYNDYANDEFSLIPNCTAENPCVPARSPYLSIANRADLVPLNATTGVLGEEISNTDMAAYDAKVISYTKYMAGMALTDQYPAASLVNGPTYGGSSNIPKFVYSTSLVANLSHFGIPDEVAFPWVDAGALFDGAPVPIPFPATAEAMASFTYMEMDVAPTFIPEIFDALFPTVLKTAMAGQDVKHRLERYTWTNAGVKLVLSIRMANSPFLPLDAASVFASYKATQIALSAMTFSGLDAQSVVRTSVYTPKATSHDVPVDVVGDYWIVPLSISGVFGLLAIISMSWSAFKSGEKGGSYAQYAQLPAKDPRPEDASGFFVDRA